MTMDISEYPMQRCYGPCKAFGKFREKCQPECRYHGKDVHEVDRLNEQVYTASEPDPVNHPTHYTSHPSGVECITVTEHMNFNKGNAVKYIWRAGDKGNEIQDLEKARWYVDREIERLKRMR